MTTEPGCTIGDAARRTGVSVHTLRFYERAGLMATDVPRTGTGRRRYRHQDLVWIRICAQMRETGMPLARIRRYADLVRAGEGNETRRLEVLEDHRDDVLRRLDELRTHLELIDYKVDVYRERLSRGDAGSLWSARPS